MKKLLVLIIFGFAFFLSPYIPLSEMSCSVSAATTNLDYVDGDYPKAMDKAKGKTKDMNAPGHVSSTKTSDYLDLVRRIQPITGLTTYASINDPETKDMFVQLYNESFVGYSNKALAYLYKNPPASTYAFVEDLGQSLGFIPKRVYAQGYGFNALQGLLPIWKGFRNIAYVLLTIAMVIVGLLIMFRKKIDPKTVITVQNALPNIVITLLLITFSYAIVGILIDLMNLVIALAITMLASVSNGLAINEAAYQTFLTGSYTEAIVYFLALGPAKGFAKYVFSLGENFGIMMNGGTYTGQEVVESVKSIGIPIFADSLETVLKIVNVGDAIASTAGAILIFTIISLAFLFMTIRLFFVLVGAYIQIIMSLLISPLQLLLGVFPGSNAFENWIKNLIANLAAFPIAAIMLLIGCVIIECIDRGAKIWTPPMLNPTLIGRSEGGASSLAIMGIITIGIISGIPSVINSVKDALKAKSFASGGLGGIGGMITGPINVGTQIINTGSQIDTISGGEFGKFLGFKKGSK